MVEVVARAVAALRKAAHGVWSLSPQDLAGTLEYTKILVYQSDLAVRLICFDFELPARQINFGLPVRHYYYFFYNFIFDKIYPFLLPLFFVTIYVATYMSHICKPNR